MQYDFNNFLHLIMIAFVWHQPERKLSRKVLFALFWCMNWHWNSQSKSINFTILENMENEL